MQIYLKSCEKAPTLFNAFEVKDTRVSFDWVSHYVIKKIFHFDISLQPKKLIS